MASLLSLLETTTHHQPHHTTTMKTEYTLRPMIREMVRTCTKAIRETRADRSVPALLGCGYTVAIRKSPSCYAQVEGGFNFSGTWNRGTCYWTKATAIKVLMSIVEARHPLADQLVVTHHNDLRDIAEKRAYDCLCHCFKARNHKG
jgi:hypothetical protein